MDKQTYMPLNAEGTSDEFSHKEVLAAARSATFWSQASQNFRRGRSKDDRNMDVIVRCDTGLLRVSHMFKAWGDSERKLMSLEALRNGLSKNHQLSLTVEQLDAAMSDIERSNPKLKRESKELLSFDLFACFWQRLMFGVLYRENEETLRSTFAEPDVKLIKYSNTEIREQTLSEFECHFGAEWLDMNEHASQWLRVDHATHDRLIRFGLKAQLHPLATEDAINASMDGITKVRRHRNQYFVCLEIYKLKEILKEDDQGESRVTPRVTRSVVFIVTTGKPGDFRTQTITLVDAEIKGKLADPLDRFKTDDAAGTSVLDRVHRILKRDHELRHHDADFLLFIILHCATDEMLPIIREYSYRLTKLKDRLERKIPFDFNTNKGLDEVSDMSIELKELGQWIHSMQGIIEHLFEDAERDIKANKEEEKELFGKSEKNEDLRLHLSDTRDNLAQLSDRLHVLETMALSVREDHARYRENRMQRTLYNLTVCTFIFMPFQILAGIYGMNFVDADGRPAIPELNWGVHGYIFYWLASFLISFSMLCFAQCIYCCYK